MFSAPKSMKNLKYISLVFILFLSTAKPALAQNDEQKFRSYSKTMSRVLSVEGGSVKEDSVYLYSFNFQVEFSKNSVGRLIAGNLSVNDSLAYKIFPKYNSIKEIDFSFLHANKERFKVVIPVIVYFKNHKEKTVIDFDAALNATYSINMPTKTNNNGPIIYLGHREVLEEKPRENFMDFRINIYMPVIVVELFFIQ